MHTKRGHSHLGNNSKSIPEVNHPRASTIVWVGSVLDEGRPCLFSRIAIVENPLEAITEALSLHSCKFTEMTGECVDHPVQSGEAYAWS